MVNLGHDSFDADLRYIWSEQYHVVVQSVLSVRPGGKEVSVTLLASLGFKIHQCSVIGFRD
jgi:hypothetical protein